MTFLLEVAAGVEPANDGFADRSLSHLGMPPQSTVVLHKDVRNVKD
jgi:hypothetical protein